MRKTPGQTQPKLDVSDSTLHWWSSPFKKETKKSIDSFQRCS